MSIKAKRHPHFRYCTRGMTCVSIAEKKRIPFSCRAARDRGWRFPAHAITGARYFFSTSLPPRSIPWRSTRFILSSTI